LDQRVLHPGHGLLHGSQRLANHRWAHFLGPHVAQFFQLQEIEEGIGLGWGDQAGPFPARQLSRSDAQHSQYIGSNVPVHLWVLAGTYYESIVAVNERERLWKSTTVSKAPFVFQRAGQASFRSCSINCSQ